MRLRLLPAVVAGLLSAALAGAPRLPPLSAQSPPLVVYVRADCPHCAAAKRFLGSLQADHPGLVVTYHDVLADTAARSRLLALARERGIAAVGVPAILVGGELLIGWESDATTGADLVRRLGLAPVAARPPPPAPPDVVQAPLLGPLSASRLGLPLFTLLVGLVDGFNPCAMWALLLILALLVGLGDRRRMLLLGGTFIVVGGAMYFMFMAAWLELFLLIGISRGVQVTLGLLAVGAGVVHLKDALAPGRGPSLSIPASAKPGIYARMRRVVTAERFGAALLAVAVLSVMVNVVELLCTAGLPAVYTQVLGAQGLSRPAYYAYLLLYVVAYVADDLLVLGVATVTLSRTTLQQGGGRGLKLVSGVVIVVLGVLLVFRPEWLR